MKNTWDNVADTYEGVFNEVKDKKRTVKRLDKFFDLEAQLDESETKTINL